MLVGIATEDIAIGGPDGALGVAALPLDETRGGGWEGFNADRGDSLGPRGPVAVAEGVGIQVGGIAGQRGRGALEAGVLIHEEQHGALDADGGNAIVPLAAAGVADVFQVLEGTGGRHDEGLAAEVGSGKEQDASRGPRKRRFRQWARLGHGLGPRGEGEQGQERAQ